jgi:type IV pilus assembly protein PilB
MLDDSIIQKNSSEIDWDNLMIPKEIVSSIPLESVEKYGFIPFRSGDDFIDIAILDIEDINTQNAIQFYSRKNEKKVRVFKVTEDVFKNLLKKVKNPEVGIGRALRDLEESAEEEKSRVSSVNLRKEQSSNKIVQDAPVAKMVEVILKNAIDGKASDIHIEPIEDNVRVRYRVDGILHSSIFLPQKVGPAIVSRIKILSNLKIDEKRKPQDGRFRINDLDEMIDFRVSTFPVSHGEKVVMRILNKSEGLVSLDDLGLRGEELEKVKEIIKEPFGIILVTGPTGSGKSTTLYSILKILNKEGNNIVTLEDPVEYMVDGISQSQVKPEIDYTFASGLRSVLRQDPDVIMVGEIRDSETAELAIHAALTGHLVLSTLHTNDSIGAVPRLIDMGIQPFLLSSALKLVVGQRLVRKICKNCRAEQEDVSAEVQNIIRKELKGITPKVLKEIGFSSSDIEADHKLYYGKGCSKCLKNGMKGRMGIFETLEIDRDLAKTINKDISRGDVEDVAKRNGFTTMKQDGIIKALQGLTTFEEIERVTEDSGEEVIQAKGE